MAVITWEAVVSLKFYQIFPFPCSSESAPRLWCNSVQRHFIISKRSSFCSPMLRFWGHLGSSDSTHFGFTAPQSTVWITPYLVGCCYGLTLPPSHPGFSFSLNTNPMLSAPKLKYNSYLVFLSVSWPLKITPPCDSSWCPLHWGSTPSHSHLLIQALITSS